MADESIYVKDLDCHLIRISRSMARNLGLERPEDVVGLTDLELFGPEFGARTMLEDRRVMANDEPLLGLIESRQLDGGGMNWTLTSKVPLHDASGAVVGLLGITSGINEIKQAESNLQYLATHDSLTGLPNRFLLGDRLIQLIGRASRQRATFALMFIDIDDFKAINDERGHDAGDELLRSLGQRFHATVRNSDTVARIGGDEFVVVVEGVDRARGTELGRKLIKAAAAPFHAGGSSVKVTISVGLAMYPDHGLDAATLMAAADQAMYLAKHSGKNRCHTYAAPGRNALAATRRPA